MIQLSVNDFEFAQQFQSALRNIGLNSKLTNSHERHKNARTNWIVRGSNCQFVDWYKALTPSEIRNILIGKRLKLAFFQGFYEAEGTFYLEQDGRQRYGKARCKITVCNSNKPLLVMIQHFMNELGFDFRLYPCYPRNERVIKGRLVKFSKPVFRLDLQKRLQVKELLSEINPSIPRKRWVEERRQNEASDLRDQGAGQGVQRAGD